MSTNIRIDHDGSFGFSFYGINEVRRAALFTEDFELIEHYVFPSISGGKIMTVTPLVDKLQNYLLLLVIWCSLSQLRRTLRYLLT